MAVFRPPRIHGGGNGATSGVAPDPPSGAFSAGQYHSSLNAWSGRNYGSYEDSGPDLPPVPLEWIIAPLDGSKKCPTPIDTIATFLASALISALCLGAVLGRRTVVNRLTCGRFGEKDGKKRNHLFVWLLGFGLASLGNVFSMLLVTNTKGYEHLHKATIFALYASRPRLTLPLMAALRVLVWRKDYPGPEEDPDAGEFVYVGGYVSSAIAELVLQVVAAGFIGYTWGRFPNKPIKDYMQDTLRYMEILPAVTFICLLIVPIWHLRPTWRGPAQRWLYACMVLLCYVAVITAPWVYWTFFLGLPGSLWCPPNLVGQGVIWAVFDIFAGFFGA